MASKHMVRPILRGLQRFGIATGRSGLGRSVRVQRIPLSTIPGRRALSTSTSGTGQKGPGHDQAEAHGDGIEQFLGGLFMGVGTVLTVLYYSGGGGLLSTEAKPQMSSTSTSPLGSVVRPQYDLSQTNIEGAKQEFRLLLGDSGVDDNLPARISRSSTAWSPAPHGALDRPCMIVYPRTTEEVSQIVRICHRRRLPMIGFGGGTSLEATLAAIHGEVCIDFGCMNKVLAVHEEDMDVVVQPGVPYLELNDLLMKRYNLLFPPDPGPGAQIGGMISQGCSGTSAYRYGTVKDWVLGLTVVLADGTIVKTRRRPKKSSAGYDLTRLFVGSEGTLGFVTEATLKVTSVPENTRVAVVAFPSVQNAVDAAVKIVQKSLPLGALELLDGTSMRAINNSGYCAKELVEAPSLFLKFSGSKAVVAEQIELVKRIAKDARCLSFDFGRDDVESEAYWQARKTMLWSLMTLKRNPDDKFLGTDLAVPISRLGDVIEVTNRKLEESGLVGACCGHVGDGNVHAAIFYIEAEKEKAEKVVLEVEQLGIQVDGTITGEHGIGLEKRDRLIDELGVDSVDTMRRLKLALDPLCLLNPEKVVRLTPAS
ncbi:D-lactate ferricytochrome c oxidoreductase [Exophiala dermatitidis]|nr:D-lactate ferricytochrome c oxidoreductase [Exophiala dermatitidis]KAJ4554243.1 D-lactate ferricytochrome c oxidoreductase [Exophiala dermatitidis]KAJ4580324.1 D-lactate ferricytochrome c oxidoreductase [Exophiala dermatitidis]KAJ4585509.1 D-lactate ferricytochrome c oxidoreductase [Exophiala dermatitidis]KAJ4598507.1 D-lactate ferricytochrome c oxidoreductase [Exophiala dermatitidis]